MRRKPLVLSLASSMACFGGDAAGVDLVEHFEDGDIGPAVEGAPEGADAGGAGGEQVGPAGADDADGGGGAVLFVVGVEHEDQVQRLIHLGRGDVLRIGHGEHHVEEVRDVAELGVGVDVGHAHRAAVGIGGDRADLADELDGLLVELFVVEPHGQGVEAGQGIDHGREDGHGGGVDGESLEVVAEGFVRAGRGG